MAFPANELAISDLGSRLRLHLPDGAVIEDHLTLIHASRTPKGQVRIAVQTRQFGHLEDYIQLLPDASVEYLDE